MIKLAWKPLFCAVPIIGLFRISVAYSFEDLTPEACPVVHSATVLVHIKYTMEFV